ncbi:hypothetical protein DOTSEDRAFT_72878, partial [Dothistroma septosporum NZE10]
MPGFAETVLDFHEKYDDDASHPDIVDAGDWIVTAKVGKEIRAQQREQIAALGIRHWCKLYVSRRGGGTL